MMYYLALKHKNFKFYIYQEKASIVSICWCKKNNYQEIKTLLLEKAKEQILDYLNARRIELNFNYKLTSTSSFQELVLKSLKNIPYGKTLSYKELALMIGRPKAYRAVARALNANPLCLIYPCHRVIAENGALLGYSGGVELKDYLLNMERVKDLKR